MQKKSLLTETSVFHHEAFIIVSLKLLSLSDGRSRTIEKCYFCSCCM